MKKAENLMILPALTKTPEQFNYYFQSTVDRKVMRELSGLGFMVCAENVVLLSPAWAKPIWL